jgi:c(7)-type cytochrome triheme protein
MNLRAVLVSLLVMVSLTLGMQAGLAAPGDAPGDIIFERPGGDTGGFAAAFFPHWVHQIRYRCYVCHPKIFAMKKGANKVTMDAINQGKFCGVCHNGEIAWKSDFESCSKCHPS